MSIFKDTFRDYVRRQLILREELIDIGNTSDQGERTNRLQPYNRKSNPNAAFPYNFNLKKGAFYTYTTNRQCVIRMTSLVDYVDDVGLDIGDLNVNGESFQRLKGAALSRNFILQGGTLSDFSRVVGDRVKTRRVDQVRESFPRPDLKTNLAYGDFAIGADASEDGYGIVPMPGIIDATVRTKSAYGSLREAKINFECHNRRQLEILEMLYMRPGYMTLLEWGWCPYIKSSGNVEEAGKIVNHLRLVENETNDRIYTNNITQQEVFNAINQLKETQDGNYDGMLGFVKNFGFQAREDGGFSCFTELISIGEVIESLKQPSISIIDPSPLIVDDPMFDKYGFTGRHTNAEKYTKANSLGLIPEFNGLEGLMRSLNNYCLLELRGGARGDAMDTLGSQVDTYEFLKNADDDDTIEDVFEDVDERDDLTSADKAVIKTQLQTAYNTSGLQLNNAKSLAGFYQNMLRYQSSHLAETLRVLLKAGGRSPANSANHLTGLSDYILTPWIGEDTTKQGYIRWDALTVLINAFLIPRTEKGTSAINVVTDRIYDLDNNTSKIDPLLFAPISTFDVDNPNVDNYILDASGDANVCILPLQFELPGGAPDSEDSDPRYIKTLLGYQPDISRYPIGYIKTIYSKTNRITKYRDIVVPVEKSNWQLNDTDKLRRIGSIFLNIKMLLNIADKNKDNQDYSIGQFINDVWSKVNDVCPNHNFVLKDDKESSTIFIIDLPVDNSEIPPDLHTFIPFSNKNILRSFEYTSNVPSALSSTIAIQAQDPRSIEDIDGVTFAAFNRSIKNRLFSNDLSSNFRQTANDIRARRSKLANDNNLILKQIQNYNVNFFRNLINKDNDKETIGIGNMVGLIKTYQTNSTYLSGTLSNSYTFNSVIPLEFSATLDGISGIVIGNLFKIQKDRLPKAYAQANIGFIVFNEEQKITAGGDWTTDISGKMTILPEKKIDIKGIATNIKADTTDEDPQTETVTTATDGGTEEYSEGQDLVSDISEVPPGGEVYLKFTKDPSLEFIGDEDVRNKSIGLTFVRRTPLVDNETGFLSDGYYDNSVGAFNSFDNGGIFLGRLKQATYEGGSRDYLSNPDVGSYDVTNQRYNEYYGEGQIAIYKNFDKYFINPPSNKRLLFNNIPEIEKNGIIGYRKSSISREIVSEDGGSQFEFRPDIDFIAKSDTTRTKSVWYCILFDKSVDNLFNGGWVRMGNNVDLDGADYYTIGLAVDNHQGGNGIDYGAYNFSSYSPKLSTYSQYMDCWMRFDTIAHTPESALQLVIQNNFDDDPNNDYNINDETLQRTLDAMSDGN